MPLSVTNKNSNMPKQPSDILRLQNELAEWSDQQFGYNRSPIRPIKHLQREVEELLQSPDDPMEYADCLLLIIDAFRMAGGNADELIKYGFQKLEINRQRQWGTPDADGVTEHVRDEKYS